MPTYSPDSEAYRLRVHRNGRAEDPNFTPDELLYRRFQQDKLVNGWPMSLNISMDDASGISVNRERYSLPQDVLEPDCCDGNRREGMVVLQFAVSDLPEQLSTSEREYRFKPKHAPLECCYAHSAIWCNGEGNIDQPYEKPSKTARDLFRARLLEKMKTMGREPRTFRPHAMTASG